MRGYTLVELTMVIVIIGILAAVVGPRFFDRRVFDERLFYEESLAAVRYGQKLAVASGCPIRATIAQSGYALSYDQNCADATAGSSVASPSGGPLSGGNPQIVAVSSPGLNVVFNSLGSAPSTGSADSHTVSFGIPAAFTITVSADTGFIETTP